MQRAGSAPISDPGSRRRRYLAAGQSLTNLDFRLTKGGAITGRLVDANGEPVPEVSIMAMRRSPSSAAAGLFAAPVQGGQITNDIGEFRIAGLAPGEYVVAAMPGGVSPFGGMSVAPAPASAPRSTAATTYYPGTADQDAAGTIVITPGAEIGNIVSPCRTGVQRGGDRGRRGGRPVAHAMVMLMGDPRWGFRAWRHRSVPVDGRFVIGGVPAGTYQVIATIMIMGGDPHDPIAAGGATVAWPSGAGGGGAGFFPIAAGGPSPPAEVVVTNADVENVRVVTPRPPQ